VLLRHRDRRVGAAARALMQHLAREEAKR